MSSCPCCGVASQAICALSFVLTPPQWTLFDRLISNREKELSNEQHLTYLQETDWYVVRKADTGVGIPTDVSTKRQAAREAIQKLSSLE